MTSYKLPENYIENLEALLRKKQSRTASSICYSSDSQTSHPRTIRYSNHGQDPPRLLHLSCCQRAHWARCQRWGWELRALHQPHYDGVGKPIPWFAKRGCERVPPTLPRIVRHHLHQGHRT